MATCRTTSTQNADTQTTTNYAKQCSVFCCRRRSCHRFFEKKDQDHQNDNTSDKFLRDEISALKHKIETMELILMSVLPEYKHHQLLQNIDSKPSLARAKNVVEATEDIESNGTKYQQDKKNVSLTRN